MGGQTWVAVALGVKKGLGWGGSRTVHWDWGLFVGTQEQSLSGHNESPRCPEELATWGGGGLEDSGLLTHPTDRAQVTGGVLMCSSCWAGSFLPMGLQPEGGDWALSAT